ncbi:MAG TPA: DUF885 domain-containing protein [Steroidobacteraceae bacterium]|jgi:uncharacterized protein (DUF885 family)|nr:DUF885 domain-containing protein [Steroidobacteraceae bacterium]
MKSIAMLLLCVAATAPGTAAMAHSAHAARTGARVVVATDAGMMALADDYFDHFYFPSNPSTATSDGIHRYDDRLEDFGRAEVERQVKVLQGYERRFQAVEPSGLSERVRGDRELLLSSIRSTLLTLRTIRPWEKDADSYSAGISAAALTLMQRDFAPANERLRLLCARERLMPAALRAARANLRNPPRIYTEIAIEQLPAIVSFFEDDLPAAFSAADDAALRREFTAINAQVIAALKSYQSWLTDDLLPRSHGDFRIGAATLRAKLAYDEMVDIPLERLLDIGMADLRRNQAEFTRVARELAPDKTAQQVLADLAEDHPAPEQLLDSFRATFDGLIGFITEHQIITVPSTVRPVLRETPAFMRAITFASMDTPGPFETVAQEAYFNVTLPDPAWDAAKTAGFMAQFNYPVISNVAVHEAYPGHYMQFLWMHRLDDRVRQLIGANTNSEGWAHYCEQMMLDEGYGQPGVGTADQRQSRLLRLGQLQHALLRNARYIVGIKLHTGQMTVEQAIDFFVKQGYQSREVGEVETKRGTSDPTYMYYTLGKLQILKLRSDLQAREGSSFRLRDFHDAFMQQGFPPIKLVRRALLQDDSPTL